MDSGGCRTGTDCGGTGVHIGNIAALVGSAAFPYVFGVGIKCPVLFLVFEIVRGVPSA
jgi:hypothetical protein